MLLLLSSCERTRVPEGPGLGPTLVTPCPTRTVKYHHAHNTGHAAWTRIAHIAHSHGTRADACEAAPPPRRVVARGATPPLRARHTYSRPAPHYATPARPDPVVSLRGRFPEATPSKRRAALAASPRRPEAPAQPQWPACLRLLGPRLLRAAPPALRHDGARLSPSPSSGPAVAYGPADVPCRLVEPHLGAEICGSV